mgnify:FL=1
MVLVYKRCRIFQMAENPWNRRIFRIFIEKFVFFRGLC